MNDHIAYRAALRMAIEDLILERYERTGYEPEETVDRLEQEFLQRAGMAQGDVGRLRMPEVPVAPPEVGDEVIVLDGPMASKRGVVIEFRGKAKDVVVELDVGMVQFKLSQVRKKS